MKKMIKYIATLLSGAVMFASCGASIDEISAHHTPAINKSTIKPMPTESGSDPAYIGTQVTAGGFNLDLVGLVTINGVEAEIMEQDIKTVKFKIPALDLPQQDIPHMCELVIYDADKKTVVFNLPYYVTVPVTDALVTGYAPKEGTVGTEITISGRNLEQVTRVKFGSTTVEASAFTSLTGAAIKFAAPAAAYAAGNSTHAIEAEWGVKKIDVTGSTLFKMRTPRFETLSQGAGQTSVIGDEIPLAGENLDLVDAVKWGAYEITIIDRTETTMTVKFPSAIELANPAVQSKAITAEWGVPTQTSTVVGTWALNTTPLSTVTVPVVASMTAADGYYIGKEVTITGEELTAVEGIELWYNDGADRKIAATIKEGTTDAKLVFVVPDGVTFSTATDVEVKVLYNTTDNLKAGNAKVYPFYVYKGLRMGTGSNSKSTYPAYNQENAFLLLNSGTIISTDDWWDNGIDAPVKANNQNVTTAAQTVTGSAASYDAVQPYLFFSASSAHKLGLNSPGNSNSQLKTQFYGGSQTALPSLFGTPVFYFRVLTGAADGDMKASITGGTVESLVEYATMGGSAAPAFATAESSSAWIEGSVIVMQYVKPAYCKGTGDKPTELSQLYNQGFMHIRSVTNADKATGLANTDRVGYVEFDLYWSKPIK